MPCVTIAIKRRTAALRLVRRADLHLELTAGRKVLVHGEAPPEVVATVRELRAELAEFLEGHRCLACGGGLAGRDDVPVEGGGFAYGQKDRAVGAAWCSRGLPFGAPA